jgi:hypothetical protein
VDLTELQAELHHFAAEHDWQPFHTPKNLATAGLGSPSSRCGAAGAAPAQAVV